MKRILFIILAVLCFLAPCIPWTYSIVKSVQFDARCGDYLKLSADANSIELAEKHLTTAIDYLEKNDSTSGYTKFIVYKPKNDIGLWYENLKAAQTQLQELQAKESVTELEESNMLMKLRETLLDEEGGLTLPLGISQPQTFNVVIWLNVTLSLLWFLGGFFIYCAYEY